MNITDKNAIITGTSKGLGLSITKALLEQGVKVAGWSRTAPSLTHPNFHYIEADLADEQSVAKAFARTQEVMSKDIHILINNAGIGPKGNMDEMDPAAWRKVFDVNVHGIFYVSRLVIPGMKALQSGHIINISSGAGTNGIPGMTAYCGSKHAVHGISHAMHAELRKDGIKVTCLSPGSIATDFGKSPGDKPSDKNKLKPEDMATAVIHALSMPKNFHYVDMEVRPLQP